MPLKCFPTSLYRPPAPAQVSGCAAGRLDTTSSLRPPPPSRGRDFEGRTLTSACEPFGVRSAQGPSPEGGIGSVEGLGSFPRLWDPVSFESTWPKAPHSRGRDFEGRTLTSACEPFGVRSAQGPSPEGGIGSVEGLGSFPRLWDPVSFESTWPKAPHGGGPLAMQASPRPLSPQDLYNLKPPPCATITYQILSLIRCL